MAKASDVSPHYRGKDPGPFTKDEKGEMIVPAINLTIIWGKDERYWKIPSNDKTPAELQQVCWLEVKGYVDETDVNKEYEVGFKLSLTEDAFGWSKNPLYLMIKRGNEPAKWQMKSLNNMDKEEFLFQGKLEKNTKGDDKKIYFGLYEVWSGYWKGGLKIHHAFVREMI